MRVHDLIAAVPLERGSAAPLFRQLYARLKDAILQGALAPGARLPPTRTDRKSTRLNSSHWE